ncbi:MAG TPA: DUF192 domain-containing protein [Tepidisphaeraceae bacterium]|jgi:hypothetical protein|nr:DUF192 domain-containing protein [Tepidisphaeraceae bacterium]
MKRVFIFSLLLVLLPLAGGCRRSETVMPTASMRLGNRTFTLDVAATPEAQKAGLGGRDSIPADRGLIYVFGDETTHFRAENSRVPLDVIFANSAGKVVSIRSINANDTTPVSSEKPAFYAIELNRGAAGAAGVKVGDQLSIPPGAFPLPVVEMKIGSGTFNLEVARSDQEQQTGLMNRDAMPADHGMIFVFPNQQERGFWMKNTRLPLDIIFVDSVGRVVSVRQMRPYDDQHFTHSNGAARYAIELNKGVADSVGIKAGDKLTIPPGAQ